MDKKLEQLQRAIISLGDKMESMRRENRALQQRISLLNEEKTQLSQECEQMVARCHGEIKRMRADCDQEITSYKDKIQQIQDDANAQNVQLQKEKNHLRDVLTQGATVFTQLLSEMPEENGGDAS